MSMEILDEKKNSWGAETCPLMGSLHSSQRKMRMEQRKWADPWEKIVSTQEVSLMSLVLRYDDEEG